MHVRTFRKGTWFTVRKLINKDIPALYRLEQGCPQNALILYGVDEKMHIFFSIQVSLETTRSVLIYKECTSFLIAIPS